MAEIDIADDSEEPVFITHIDWNLIKEHLNKEWQIFQNERMKKKETEADERMKRIEELLKSKKNTDN